MEVLLKCEEAEQTDYQRSSPFMEGVKDNVKMYRSKPDVLRMLFSFLRDVLVTWYTNGEAEAQHLHSW